MKQLSYFFLLLFASATYAQSSLDTITITNALAPQPVTSTGRNIIIIPGEQFADLPIHSVDELLRYTPGVEVQMRGPAGSQSDIVLRGGTFQQVLVLLDGLRLNDPNTGHFNSYIPVAPAEIERIEILKGAASAIYGSEAVGGVIHIITKAFASGLTKTKQLEATASAGEYGFINANLGGGYANGTTVVTGGLLTNNADGQPQRGINGYYNNHTASLALTHQFTPALQLAVRSAYDSRRFAAQNFYTSFLSDTASEKVNTFWNQLRLTWHNQRSSVAVNAGYKNVHDEFQYNPSSLQNDNTSNLYQFLTTWQYKLNSNAVLVSGVQHMRKTIRSNDRGNHNRNQAAAFVSYLQSINNFTVNPSIRLDHTSPRGWELVPQLNLSLTLNRFQFRASGGKTVRDADFTEQYNNYNKVFVSGGRIGNPDLQAERSWSWEAGVDYLANQSLKISGSFFQRYHSRLIDYTPTSYDDMPRKDNLSPTGSYALATNLYKLTTTGAELDLQLSRQIGRGQNITASAGFTWLKTTSDSSLTSFYIRSHARYLVNTSLVYNISNFSLSLAVIYKDREPQVAAGLKTIPGHCYMMNAKLSYHLLQNRLSVFVQADNITDETCSDLIGAQLPGRWFTGGLRFRFL